MSEASLSHPPPHDAPPESDAADAPDPRITRAEERLVMLRELAELGMALARELTRLVVPPENPEASPEPAPYEDFDPGPRRGPRRDPANDFARLSRAVRLTLALEATVEDRLDALRAGELVPAAETGDDQRWACHRPFPGDYSTRQRNKIRDAVFDIVDRDITDIHRARDILKTCHERLTESERYPAFGSLPLREAVEAICKDLGLQPDWSLWTDDGWPPSPLSARQIWDRFWPSREQLRKRKLQ